MNTKEDIINKQDDLLIKEHSIKLIKNKILHISKLIIIFLILFFILSYTQNTNIYSELNIFSH